MPTSRLLLTQKNTSWGTIINPNSPNVSRHILSFKDQRTKDTFLSKSLFGSGNWNTYKLHLVQSPNVKYNQIDSKTISFFINPNADINRQYNRDELMNKDYAILRENNKIKFYNLTLINGAGNLFEFRGDLDIFMTYDIKDMFADRKLEINRAHIDRFQKIGTKISPAFHNILQMSSPLFNAEPFDDNMKQQGLVDTIQQLNADIPIDESLSTAQKTALKDSLFNTKYSVLYNQSPGQLDTKGIKDKIHATSGYTNPEQPSYYQVAIGLFTKGKYVTETSIQYSDEKKADTVPFPKQILTDPKNALKYGFTVLKINPMVGMRMTGGRVVANFGARGLDHTLNYNVFNPKLIEIKTFKWDILSSKGSTDYVVLADLSKKGVPRLTTLNGDPLVFEEVSFNLNKYNLHNNFKNEIKAYFSPYVYFRITDDSGETFDISPQFVKDLTMDLIGDNKYTPGENGVWVQLVNYIKTGGIKTIAGLYLNSNSTQTLPTYKNALEEFMLRNKNQRQTQIERSAAMRTMRGISAGIGSALGVGGSGVTKNILGGIGSIVGGAFGVGSSIIDHQYLIQGMKSQENDLRNIPEEITGNFNLMNLFNYKQYGVFLIKYKLPEYQHLQIRKWFYKWGYNLNNKLDNINNYLKTRYWFNYIQASETFENIKLEVSSAIKQDIDNLVKQGITIWHVRGDDFKGIKNYDNENVEMSLVDNV